MEQQPQKPKDILKNISFVYWVMLLGLVTFIVVSSIFISNAGEAIITDPQSIYIIKTILILILIVLAPVSYVVPQKLINQIDKTQPLANKLQAYRFPSLVRYGAMNTAGVIIALGFMLTANTNLLFLQAIVILFFLIYKPSPFKIASDLDLNDKEKQELMPE